MSLHFLRNTFYLSLEAHSIASRNYNESFKNSIDEVSKQVLQRFTLLGHNKGDIQGPVEHLILGIARGSEPRECIWHMRKKTTKTCHSCLKDKTTNLLGDLKFDHDQRLLMISTL